MVIEKPPTIPNKTAERRLRSFRYVFVMTYVNALEKIFLSSLKGIKSVFMMVTKFEFKLT